MGNQELSQEAEATFSLGAQLARVLQILEERMPTGESVRDYDQTFVVGAYNLVGTAAVGVIGPLPRTLKHVEIEFYVAAPNGAVLGFIIQGNNSVAQSAQSVNPSTALSGTGATCMSGGGKVTVRDYLDGSGYLTVFIPWFSPNNPTYANVRVRSLDLVDWRGKGAASADVALVDDGG